MVLEVVERALVAAEHGEELTEQMLVYAGGAPRARKPLQLSALVDDMRQLVCEDAGDFLEDGGVSPEERAAKAMATEPRAPTANPKAIAWAARGSW